MKDDNRIVLVADDHETFVMYISILLRRMGFTVIPAENGKAALEFLDMVVPDLVLLDINMPVMGGLETLDAIRCQERFADLPVVIITAYSKQLTFEECRKRGGFDFMTKPLSLLDLNRVVQRCLDHERTKVRRNLRCSFQKKVELRHGEQTRDYFALTLSEGGVYLRTMNPLPVGTEVDLTLSLKKGQRLSVKGRVLYHVGIFSDICRVDPCMAVEFQALEPNQEAALRACILELLAGDLLEEQQEQVLTLNGPGRRPVEAVWDLVGKEGEERGRPTPP